MLGNLIPHFHLFGKDIEFGIQDGGLKSVQAAVDADAGIVVFVRPLAMDFDGIHEVGKRIIIRETHAAISVAAQWFGRKKGRAGNVRQGTGLFSFVFCAE